MTKANCLAGTTICISGALSCSKAEMTAKLKATGAGVAGSFTANVTHVLSTAADVAKQTAKVVAADGKGLPVVGESWVDGCIKAGKRVPEKPHLLAAGGAAPAGKNKTAPKAKPAAGGPKKAIAKKAPGKKKAAKMAAAAADSDEDEEDEDAGGPKIIARGECGGPDARLCRDDDGEYLEAQLSQIEVQSNTDKYYTTQVVENGSTGEFWCTAHWGRTGTKGQTSCEGPFLSQAFAAAAFDKKFKSKAGVAYSQRQSYVAKAKKYSYKVVNYARDETGTVVWQYFVDDFVDGKRPGWYDYFADASEGVDAVYVEWEGNQWLNIRCIASGNWTYRIDFTCMVQENTSTKKLRKIRRTLDGNVTNGENDDGVTV